MIAAAETVSLHDTVTNRIIRELEQGCFPWVQPWASSGMTTLGLPLNASTGRAYSGVNILLLWFAAILTLYTGYDYFRAGAGHLIEEDER